MTDPTIPELVARLRELLSKAHPLPWLYRGKSDSLHTEPDEPPYSYGAGFLRLTEYDDAEATAEDIDLIVETLNALPTLLDALEREQEPVPMVLFCPNCGDQHIDKPDPSKGWENPPHRSHLCLGCGCIWRPADVPTMGVVATQTEGRADTWHGSRAEPHGDGAHSPDGGKVEGDLRHYRQLVDALQRAGQAADLVCGTPIEDVPGLLLQRSTWRPISEPPSAEVHAWCGGLYLFERGGEYEALWVDATRWGKRVSPGEHDRYLPIPPTDESEDS